MPTQTFLRDDAASVSVTVGGGTRKLLSLAQGSALVASDNTATVAGPTSGVQVKKGGNVLSWFSPALKGFTLSGTITINLWGKESNVAANCGFDVLVERVNGAGTVQSTVLRSEFGTELGTTAAAQNWTGTPTSTTFADGDRIKVTVFANDAGGNMASGQTFTLDYGAGAGVDGDSYVQFNEALVPLDARVSSVGEQVAIIRNTVPGQARVSSVGEQVAIVRTTTPGNARVTSVGGEVALSRDTVPGNARVTSVGGQVPLVRPGPVPGNARVTSVGGQVAILRGGSTRAVAFVID